MEYCNLIFAFIQFLHFLGGGGGRILLYFLKNVKNRKVRDSLLGLFTLIVQNRPEPLMEFLQRS